MAQLAFIERLGLNPRERRLAIGLVGFLGVAFVLGLPLAGEVWLLSMRTRYDDLRGAITAVQSGRAQVRDRQQKKDAIVQRYAKRAPALAGYIEQTAREQKLQVTDSVDRPEIPYGKRYVERNTVVHFKKAGMLPIAKFTESVERSGYAASVTRLNIRKRSGEPDQFDVEVGISAYDRTEKPGGEGAAKPEEKAP